jgi:AbiTii-like protein
MSSLVLELQREALDDKVSAVSLLRKAYVVAVKLNLGQFKEWIELESKGYAGSGKETPQYRHAQGVLRVHNPFHGFQPFIIQDPELAEKVSQAWLNNPLSEIEAMANESSNESHVALVANRQRIVEPEGSFVRHRMYTENVGGNRQQPCS